MQPLRRRIEKIIHDRNTDRFSALASGLSAMSVLYGKGASLRNWGYRSGAFKSERLPCKVVSVGNITAGGTGKTPMTLYLAEQFKTIGFSVAVVSRGYKGTASKRGGVVSDGGRVCMDAAGAGDEPFMMAGLLKNIPVIVGRNRFRAGTLAVNRFHPDVIVLDDGFQHLKLERDVNLVLLDHHRPFGNGRLLPRGPLREPLSALDRADAFVLTRSPGGAGVPARIEAMAGTLPVFRSRRSGVIRRLIPAGAGGENEGRAALEQDSLKGRLVFAFSGIARNDDFIRTLEEIGCTVAGAAAFADHHAYGAADLARILSDARQAGAGWLATTEKDFVKISGMGPWPLNVAVIGVAASMGDDRERFLNFLKERLQTG